MPKVDKDYGIRPYIDNSKEKTRLNYVERSMKPTWFQALQAKLQKMSELVKPYQSDWDYPNAEQFYPRPLTFTEPRPNEYRDIEFYGKDYCAVTCFPPLYCDGDVECHPNIFRYPAGTGYYDALEQLGWAVYYCPGGGPCSPYSNMDFDKWAVRPLKIHPPESAGMWAVWPDAPMDVLKVFMKDMEENECDTTVKVFCRERTFCCDEDGYSFEFNDAGTADTIAPAGSITVYVTGGCPPYTFATSSNGYTFTAGITGNPQDVLTSADGDCGVDYDQYCNFTVTDSCGTEVSGTIRNTGGQWTLAEQGSTCHDGAWTRNCYQAASYDLMIGSERWFFNSGYPSAGVCGTAYNEGWGNVTGPCSFTASRYPPCGGSTACAQLYAGITCGGACNAYETFQNIYYYTWTC